MYARELLINQNVGDVNEHGIKVKLVNTASYFGNVAKYILSIYQEEQVAVGEFVTALPEEQ